eukprot:CAMPEP_0197184460 /NCGR_PEP_ID=MMETSP1423-20130617/9936_1 /TAXON_ID=476441 /ORGANISM="Pseudo-nitzschia heimii, Strain UNC1101" /LENGTH=551 /DNA_ID=CAMNT_0042635273 /DNA_START=86 /DNA_END=1741 /DNA_ORIENTATION=+
MAKNRVFAPATTAVLSPLAILVILGIWCAARAEEVNYLRNISRGRGEVDSPKPRPRIINGEDVKEPRYPYFSLMYGRSLCGGVLIAPRLVLGAAHCEDAADLFRIGLFEDIHDGQYVDIRSTIRHPSYEKSSLSYDIMIYELEEVADFDYVVLDRDRISGGTFTVLGFGDTNKESPLELSEALQEVELDYVDNEACDEGHGHTGEVTEDMMCVGGDDKDSCIGDSGGPLIKRGSSMEEDRLVGLVSWGRGCAEKGVPGVYARISYFYDWILKTVCENFTDEAPLYMQCRSESSADDDWVIIEDRPTMEPTKRPTNLPTKSPSMEPTTESQVPTLNPSISMFPSDISENITDAPTSLLEALFIAWGASQLEECQGDCNNDYECKDNLICFKRMEDTINIPGCTGSDLIGENVDICIDPNNLPKEATFITWDASQLQECQGDCDFDEECEGNLICFKRNEDTINIPGCIGSDRIGENIDVCINPNKLPKEATLIAWDASNLQECQGDCDFDNECEGNLICFKRNEEKIVTPGCTGSDLIGANVDVCINPNNLP